LVPAKAEAVELARLRALPAVQAARMWGEDTPVKLVALSEALLMGSLARTERRFDEAVTQLRKAADLDDELGTDPPMLGGGARLALAGALMDAGRLDEAGKEMAEALRLNGPSAWAHQGLAQLAAARGNAAESQRHADQARLAWGRAQGADLPRL
jgi:tetratricopeptide (TPR) repeat protein